MTEWQPIETAPKDGRVILAFYSGKNWIYAADPQNINCRCVHWRNDAWREWGPASYRDRDLSHWHPLPEPPPKALSPEEAAQASKRAFEEWKESARRKSEGEKLFADLWNGTVIKTIASLGPGEIQEIDDCVLISYRGNMGTGTDQVGKCVDQTLEAPGLFAELQRVGFSQGSPDYQYALLVRADQFNAALDEARKRRVSK